MSERLTRKLPDPLTSGVRSGKWLDRQTFAPLGYAVPGLIPEGFTLLVGAPKIGKSFLVLDWAIACASGGRALGAIKVEGRRPVLYLALEDGHRRLQGRCRLLGRKIPKRLDFMTDVEPGAVLDVIAKWLEMHPAEKPLVILDTLGKVMPPRQNSETIYQRDYRIGSQLKRLADRHTGASVVVNHHARKAESEDFVDSVSGTHGLAGAADTVVVVARARHEPRGLLKVTGRDVAEGEYAVELIDGGRWLLVGSDLDDAAQRAGTLRATAGLSDRMTELVEFVNRHPGGVRAAAVAKELGLDTKSVGVCLGRAVKT